MEPKAVVARCLTDVLAGSGSPEELISDESFRQRVAGFKNAFPDLAVTTHVLLAEGELVASHFSGSGTHSGFFHGVPPTGKRWEARATAVFRVEDGRIADAWVNWDLLALMEQLGGVERAPTVSA